MLTELQQSNTKQNFEFVWCFTLCFTLISHHPKWNQKHALNIRYFRRQLFSNNQNIIRKMGEDGQLWVLENPTRRSFFSKGCYQVPRSLTCFENLVLEPAITSLYHKASLHIQVPSNIEQKKIVWARIRGVREGETEKSKKGRCECHGEEALPVLPLTPQWAWNCRKPGHLSTEGGPMPTHSLTFLEVSQPQRIPWRLRLENIV